ncbi:MAG TPA: response regulator transcription factor [Verrucomicrobiae bacterium]|nr:response regulator transcription factor [Verrucomicrobiae bacterium]
MRNPIATVFVIDDDAAIRKSLARLLQSAHFDVRSFASPWEFLEQHNPATPGCILLDVSMPELNGLDLQQSLAKQGCDRPIIFLTGHGDIPMSVQAMKAGASDFLTKPVEDHLLLAAIQVAVEKDRQSRAARAEVQAIESRLATLTPREREVLEQVVSGKLNKQIASDLGTVEKTIKVHRGRVMEKMEVNSLADLVRVAALAGVSPGRPPSPR